MRRRNQTDSSVKGAEETKEPLHDVGTTCVYKANNAYVTSVSMNPLCRPSAEDQPKSVLHGRGLSSRLELGPDVMFGPETCAFSNTELYTIDDAAWSPDRWSL